MKLWLLLAALAFGEGPDGAGDMPQSSGEIEGMPPGPPPEPSSVNLKARLVASRLRCPVCQGLSVADSTSETAVTFQLRIRELVSLGYSDDQILDYFVDRYGEWILLEPPPQGLNWLIWLAPGLMAGVGLSWAAMTAVRWRKEPDEVPLPTDLGTQAKDRYEARLLAELDE